MISGLWCVRQKGEVETGGVGTLTFESKTFRHQTGRHARRAIPVFIRGEERDVEPQCQREVHPSAGEMMYVRLLSEPIESGQGGDITLVGVVSAGAPDRYLPK